MIDRYVGRALLLGALLAVGCVASGGDDAVDGKDDVFTGGKADLGFADGSPEGCMILRAANEATLAQLDDDAGLDGRAAKGIVAGRPFATLAALDAVPYVGAIAAGKLLDYATSHGLTCGGGQPECSATGGTYKGVSFSRDEECHAVDFMNHARFSEMAALGTRARQRAYDQCPAFPCAPYRSSAWRSIGEFAATLGKTSVQELKTAAASWTANGLPYDTIANTWSHKSALDNHPLTLERVYVTNVRSQVGLTGWLLECIQVRDTPTAPNFMNVCVRHNPSDSGTGCTGDAVACVDDMVGRWMDLRGVLHGSRISLADSGGTEANPAVPAVGEDPTCTATWCSMAMPDGKLGFAHQASAWTGKELLIWGGQAWTSFRADGQRFDPATNRWRPIAFAGAPAGREWPATAWTGKEMIVWGGLGQDASLAIQSIASGALYDPVADRWRAMSEAGAPSGRYLPATAWTGNELVVWGGGGSTDGVTGTGGRFDVASNHWRSISTTDAPTARSEMASAWTGKELLVWGGLGRDADGHDRYEGDGRAYDPASDSWRAIATTGAPSARRAPASVWTGREMIVWGGSSTSPDGPQVFLRDAFAYDPAADRWRALPDAPAEAKGAEEATAVWTGREAIFFGGRMTGLSPGVAYAPATETWRVLPVTFRPGPKLGASMAWTGAQLLVWGGDCASCGPDTGARIALP